MENSPLSAPKLGMEEKRRNASGFAILRADGGNFPQEQG
jgi:hypothetical protein